MKKEDIDNIIEGKKRSIQALVEIYKQTINKNIIIQDPVRSCINCKYLRIERYGVKINSLYLCVNNTREPVEVTYQDSIECELYEYKPLSME